VQRFTITEPFDGHDRAFFALDRKHETGPDRKPVHQHRASAAYSVLASEMSPGQPAMVPEGIGQRDSRLDLDHSRFAVDVEADFHGIHFCVP
jgi:hypothetical protein